MNDDAVPTVDQARDLFPPPDLFQVTRPVLRLLQGCLLSRRLGFVLAECDCRAASDQHGQQTAKLDKHLLETRFSGHRFHLRFVSSGRGTWV